MDKELRYQLLRAAIRDRKFLKTCAKDIDSSMFPTREEQTVAEAAAKHFLTYEDPIGPLLASGVSDLVKQHRYGEDTRTKIKALVEYLQSGKMELVSIQALTDKLKALKRSSMYENAVDEILAAKEEGKFGTQLLSDLFEKMRRELDTGDVILHDYLETVEARNLRRSRHKHMRCPLTLIDPIDEKTDVLGRGHFGMVMALPGGGKGLCLVKLGIAYAMQGFKVLHLTLEDPKELVEDRLDASLTGIDLTKLRVLPRRLKKRFLRLRENIQGKYHIIDGTDSDWTVTRVEQVLDLAKRQGDPFDAVIIDYDDEIVCEKQFKGENFRRFEFAEIYRRLRKMAAAYDILVWTAAQTNQKAVGQKILTMKHVAEDFSKIRKVWFAMGISSDQENERIKYLSIIKNRVGGKAGFFCKIVANWDCALFYDSEATTLMRRASKLAARKAAR